MFLNNQLVSLRFASVVAMKEFQSTTLVNPFAEDFGDFVFTGFLSEREIELATKGFEAQMLTSTDD
jgi:hypothetical protein